MFHARTPRKMKTKTRFLLYIVNTMKTREWSPKRRSEALGLIAGGRHSLAEITNITNIPKGTLSDIKKRKTAETKPQNDRPKKLTERDKRRIEIHIRLNSKTRRSTLQERTSTLTRPKILSEKHYENSDMIITLLNDILSPKVANANLDYNIQSISIGQ